MPTSKYDKTLFHQPAEGGICAKTGRDKKLVNGSTGTYFADDTQVRGEYMSPLLRRSFFTASGGMVPGGIFVGNIMDGTYVIMTSPALGLQVAAMARGVN